MDIVKLFHEEPLFLESLTPDSDPDSRRAATELSAIDALLPGDFSESSRADSEDDFSADALVRPTAYYRLYLAGTNLDTMETGATALAEPAGWAEPLFDWMGDEQAWTIRSGAVAEMSLPELRDILLAPTRDDVVVVAAEEPFLEPIVALQKKPIREAFPDLRRLLDEGARVLIPERAHPGLDWHIFSPQPIHDELSEAIADRGGSHRTFSAAFQQARSEHKFYFERWALDDLPDWVEDLSAVDE